MKRFLIAVALLLIAGEAPAQFNGCSAGFCAPVVSGGGSCTINSVSLGGNTFTGGASSGTVVGAITVSTSGTCGTDTLSVTGTNASDFQISGTNLETNGVVAGGSYSINIVATISGATGSPFTQAEVICGAGSHAATFIARTSGMSNTETTAYCNLINGLDTDSTYALFDALYIFATNTTTTADLNLVSTNFTLTSHGSCTFTADHGYTGDGSSCYLDTGLDPQSCTGVTCNFANTTAMHGVYVLTNSTSTPGAPEIDIGAVNDSTVFNYILPIFTDGKSYCSINSTSNNGPVTVGNTDGSWMCVGNSTNSVFYRNGSSIGSGTASAGAVPNVNYYILARNDSGSGGGSSPAEFSPHQLSAAWIGQMPNSTQAANIQSRINTFMTSQGINTY